MRCATIRHLLCGSLALTAVVIADPGSAQIVAQIGEITISLEEYEERARELRSSGYQHLETIDLDAKRQLLDGLIAQELLVLEGYRQGVGDDPVIAADLARRERRALMNALYDTQALHGDYTSSEQEMRAYFHEQEFDIEVMSRHIVCASEEDASAVLDGLAAGVDFDSLLARYTLPSIRSRYGNTGWVGWFRIGSLYDELKEPFRTMPTGEIYPEAVKTDRGYHIVELKERRPVAFESSEDFVREKLRTQKRANDMERYVNDLRERYAVAIDEDGIRALSQISKSAESFDAEQILVRWDGGGLTVGDYMGFVAAGRARHPSEEKPDGLPKRVDNHAGQHVMMAEARRLGLDKDLAVRRKFEDRRRALFTKWLFQHETKRRAQPDTSEASVRRFYEENLDLYTRDDGEVTELPTVAKSIRSSMVRHAQSIAMDQFIAELRERYADQVMIDEEILDRALADGITPTVADD